MSLPSICGRTWQWSEQSVPSSGLPSGSHPVQPPFSPLGRLTTTFSLVFLSQAKGGWEERRGEESQCTFISPEWAGPGWSTCVQCQCQYNFVMLWFVCQDKEEKEKLMVSKAAVEESDKEGCNSGGEEIIELQEMRMSPIPSLRNRHKQKYYKDPRGEVSQIFS